jgi:predicted transport protein
MGDIKLFRIEGPSVREISGGAVSLEKSLQTLFEKNLAALLGVRFLVSEFPTTHGGRIDTLGLDENDCPVIIEYKRSTNENVVNQGLFYLDWLMDHRRDYEWLVLKSFGQEAAENVEWTAPRLICIAGDFTKYDEHAVKQMDRNIELIRYSKFGDDLLMLDLITSNQARTGPTETAARPANPSVRTVTMAMESADAAVLDRFEAMRSFLTALGDDVITQTLKHYVAFKRIKNFACVEFHNRERKLMVFVKVDPDTIALEPGFTRDVRNVGHFGTGDLEIAIRSDEDLERAKPLLVKSYEAS